MEYSLPNAKLLFHGKRKFIVYDKKIKKLYVFIVLFYYLMHHKAAE